MKKFLVVILLIFLSCKNETKIERVERKHTPKVNTLTEISFRKSYVDHQNLTKKELDELWEEQKVKRPDNVICSDNLLDYGKATISLIQ